MDPNATWRELCATLRQLKEDPTNRDLRDAATGYLSALYNWLDRGGFPPTVED
jgi:hypothetical protein